MYETAAQADIVSQADILSLFIALLGQNCSSNCNSEQITKEIGRRININNNQEGNLCPKSHPYADSSDQNYCRQDKDWGTRLKCPNGNNCEDCK